MAVLYYRRIANRILSLLRSYSHSGNIEDFTVCNQKVIYWLGVYQVPRYLRTDAYWLVMISYFGNRCNKLIVEQCYKLRKEYGYKET